MIFATDRFIPLHGSGPTASPRNARASLSSALRSGAWRPGAPGYGGNTDEDNAQGPAIAPVTVVQYGEHQKALEDVDLQAYAAKLGLDSDHFEADRRSPDFVQR